MSLHLPHAPSAQELADNLRQRGRVRMRAWSRFPWRTTAATLRERFREDQLALTASSLTFTTILALVPFVTVALAVFTAFPIFSQMQDQLQRWLVASLIPEGIARQVLGYLTQFAGKASRLGVVGLSALMLTALALILTIDRTLNRIWRVRRPRPFAQRVLIYWAAITLGPLVLGVSLVTTSSVLAFSRGMVDAIPGALRLVLDSIEFLLMAGGMASLYHYVPNTRVKWSHAWAGALVVAVGIELAKKVLGFYISLVPTYSVLYGAFATLPILLIWIYVAWLVVLLGAVFTAYLPSLIVGVARRASAHGWQFQLAIEVLQELHAARAAGFAGRTTLQLAEAMHVDPIQLEPVLETLAALDWTGQLREVQDGMPSRTVLLADPAATPLAPLAGRLLLPHDRSLEPVWQKSNLAHMTLAEVL